MHKLIVVSIALVGLAALAVSVSPVGAEPAVYDAASTDLPMSLAWGGRGGGCASGGDCHDLMMEVREACPCAGEDGNGWTDHDAYVSCVVEAVNDLLGDTEDEGLLACGEWVTDTAEQSRIGEPGYVCGGPGSGRGGHHGGGGR